jgi:hypothetical protein
LVVRVAREELVYAMLITSNRGISMQDAVDIMVAAFHPVVAPMPLLGALIAPMVDLILSPLGQMSTNPTPCDTVSKGVAFQHYARIVMNGAGQTASPPHPTIPNLLSTFKLRMAWNTLLFM